MPCPDPRAQLDGGESQLLPKLSSCCLVVALPGLDPAAGRAPPGSLTVAETDKQHTVALIEQDHTYRLPNRHGQSLLGT